jgi:hypothetical protein
VLKYRDNCLFGALFDVAQIGRGRAPFFYTWASSLFQPVSDFIGRPDAVVAGLMQPLF